MGSPFCFVLSLHKPSRFSGPGPNDVSRLPLSSANTSYETTALRVLALRLLGLTLEGKVSRHTRHYKGLGEHLFEHGGHDGKRLGHGDDCILPSPVVGCSSVVFGEDRLAPSITSDVGSGRFDGAPEG